MAVEIEINREKKTAYSSQPQSVSSLVGGFFGKMNRGTVELSAEEALYLIDIRNAVCLDHAQNKLGFNEAASIFGGKKQMARYFTYASWRDRGLIIRPVSETTGGYGRNSLKKYPEGKFSPAGFSFKGHFYADDLACIIDDEKSARHLYDNGWFGQFGTYKADKRGRLGKLDIYETIFLARHGGLQVENMGLKDVEKAATSRRNDFKSLYEVYEDWRLNGFILKTGFKFGTHFRIYFPGASPAKGQDWVHSQHVLHVFPRHSKLLISEWARAIRVAHSVRKTFVLAIDGQKKKRAGEKGKNKLHLDFLLYHRKGQDIENPKTGKPRYLMLSLSEEEYLGGEELAKAIDECKHAELELMLGISDRETSVTYYAVKRIDIPGSEFEYYEIEWVQP